MRTRSSAAALALLVLSILVHVAPARAHDAAAPLVVALELAPTRLEAVLRYTVDRGEAARALREQFDRDADGALGAPERAALRDFLVRRALAALRIQIGDTPLVLAVLAVDEDLEGDARVDARVAVVVRLAAKVSWTAGGVSTLRVAVDLDARTIAPVTVRLGKGAEGRLALAPGAASGEASRGAPFVIDVRAAPTAGPARPRGRPRPPHR